jgi:hypothetical protein
MGFIEKRSSERGYRARDCDPLGDQRTKTFARKADAQRFLLEMGRSLWGGRHLSAGSTERLCPDALRRPLP